MPNLVPPTRDHAEDPMSPQLRAQFTSFQQLHSQHHHQGSPSKDRQGSGEDTDDETSSHHLLSKNSHGRNHDHILRMAMTTAIASQAEIDALMNGISELENIIQANNTSSARDRTRMSPRDATHPLHIGSSPSRNQANVHRSSSSHVAVTSVEYYR